MIKHKKAICKQFHTQMRVYYPSLTLEDIEKSFDNWTENKSPKGIIEMFFFPELDKLKETKQ